MLRAVISSTLALLLTVTLLWGGCISCPQFFMFPGVKAGKLKSCCDKAGRCTRTQSTSTGESECQKMPMEAHASGHLVLEAPLPDPFEHLHAALLIPSQPRFAVPGIDFAFEHSPPDIQALHSTFLI